VFHLLTQCTHSYVFRPLPTALERFFHATVFGLAGVAFAVLLTLILHFLVHRRFTFDAFLVGPECAVAASGLSFHRILDFFESCESGVGRSYYSLDVAFYATLLLGSILAYLYTQNNRLEAIKYRESIDFSPNQLEGGLHFLVKVRKSLAHRLRRIGVRIHLLNYLVINLVLGGLPMFISASEIFRSSRP
jgi:hypothetical protein